MDGVLVVTPYYNKPNRRGILEHFRAVAAATDRPVVVYNIPSRCVVDIPNDLLRELAEIPNVLAVKQARYEDLEPIEGLDLLAGNDDMLAATLDAGGTGGILVASHLVGAQMRRMIDEPESRAEIHALARAALPRPQRDHEPDPGQDRDGAPRPRGRGLPAADGRRPHTTRRPRSGKRSSSRVS